MENISNFSTTSSAVNGNFLDSVAFVRFRRELGWVRKTGLAQSEIPIGGFVEILSHQFPSIQ